MTYEEALAYISRFGRFGMKLGTERTRAILEKLGNPERGLRGALVAGTNGKGATGVCLASILRAAGRNVGFMPKPHLVSYTERIELNGVPISEEDFVRTLEELKPVLDAITGEIGQATEFEMLTAMALAYLAPRIDRLVCEVGLGGRLDATNASTSASRSSRMSIWTTRNISATRSSRSPSRKHRSSSRATT